MEKIKKLPTKRWQIILEVLDIFIIFTTLLFLVISWPSLPDTVATHYDFKGNANAWGGKSSLLFLPLLNIFMYGILTVCLRFPNTWSVPKRVTEENTDWVYGNMKSMLCVMKFSIVLMFTYIQFCDIKGTSLGIWFMIVFLFIIFAPIGFFTFRSYRNPK